MLYERIKLETDEIILRTVRKHWWIIVTRSLTAIILALIPLIGSQILFSILNNNPEVAKAIQNLTTAYSGELVFVYLGWLLLCWMLMANFWTDHYLDLWTITTRRIVSIDQRGFFSRFLSSFRLERLQDMNIEVTGVIPTLLNFGTIEAQTAGGSNEEFRTNYMPDPRGLKALIINAADERQKVTAHSLQSEGL